MKTKIFEKSNNTEKLIVTFEDYDCARNWTVLIAGVEIFDYIIRGGCRREETIHSYRRVKCPGCEAEYTFNELAPRFQYGDKLCDCGSRFYVQNLKFIGETCEIYIS